MTHLFPGTVQVQMRHVYLCEQKNITIRHATHEQTNGHHDLDSVI